MRVTFVGASRLPALAAAAAALWADVCEGAPATSAPTTPLNDFAKPRRSTAIAPPASQRDSRRIICAAVAQRAPAGVGAGSVGRARATDRQPAVWHCPDGSSHVHRGAGGARRRGAADERHSGATGDAGRPDGRPATRMMVV